jgi:hypothetical protein
MYISHSRNSEQFARQNIEFLLQLLIRIPSWEAIVLIGLQRVAIACLRTILR